MKFSRSFGLSIVLVLASFKYSWAEQEQKGSELPIVVVSASRLPSTSEHLPGTSLVTREDIVSNPEQSLTAILDSIPGVNVIQDGTPGAPVSVSIRGAEDNYTQILIDGIPVNNPADSRGGIFDLRTLDVETIERIEVSRGARSSVHGSDALGGILNIVTRGGGGNAANLVSEIGTDDFYRATARTSMGGDDSLTLSANALHDGPADSDRGTYSVGGLTGQYESSFTEDDGFSIVAAFSDSEANVFPDDSGGRFGEVTTLEERKASQWRSGFSYVREIGEQVDLTVQGNYFDLFEDIDSPAVPPGLRDPFGIPENSFETSFERLGFNGNMHWSPLEVVSVIGGVEVETEDGKSSGTLRFADGSSIPTDFALHRRTYATFLELRLFSQSPIEFNLGGRYEDPERFDAELAPHFSATLSPSDSTAITLGYYRGFKVPSFFALANPIVGNRELEPETSNTSSVDIEYTPSDAAYSIGFATYYNEFNNPVVFIDGPPPSLINANSYYSLGGELSAKLSLGKRYRVNPWISYTAIKGGDDTSALLERPRWRSGTSVVATLPSSYQFMFTARFTDSVQDSSVPTGGKKLSSYCIFDAAVSKVISEQFTARLAVSNLLDERYDSAVGVRADGIRAKLAMEVSL